MLRARFGASHIPLGRFLQCFLDAGFRFEQIEEPEGRDYPYMLALRLPAMTVVGAWDGLLQGEELAYVGTEPARPARTEPLPEGLHDDVRAALPFESIYRHQAEAWEAARRGEHVVVTTGTASGKTLAFNLPVADALAREPKLARVLPLPDEGTRAGPGSRARALGVKSAAPGDLDDGDTPTERAGRSASGRT